MTINMAPWDRIVRALVAVALVILAATGVLSGALAIVAYVVAAVFLFTALFGFCPIYRLFGIGTKRT